MLPFPTRSLAANIALLFAVFIALIGGNWAIQKFTIDHLLYRDAVSAGHSWASYLAQNIGDLAGIARGEKPSPVSMAFFERAQKVGHVFRYKIFDRDGRLRLVSDELTALGTDAQNLGEHNAAAARAIAAGQPLVIAKEGKSPDRPPFFSEAYVPVMVDGKTVAIAEAYVDQTEKLTYFRTTFTLAAIALSIVTTVAFGVPAVAWYRRTKEKQRIEARVHFLAYHDALTGLPNRDRLIEELERCCVTSTRYGEMAALHYIDLDHFKGVNDTFGHDAGDTLLKATAERLRAAAGPNDLVARLGGDEFAVLQVELEDRAQADEMARRILASLAQPIVANGRDVAASASVGVAVAPDDGENPDRLLKSAHLALYRSKDDGRNCIRFFTTAMDGDLQTRLRLERIIRDAVVGEAFELHFQPVVDMPGARLVGFEALLRLRGPDESFIPPAEFIPVAEEIGAIGKIGAWVVREACRNAMCWPDHLSVAVNLSPAEFALGSICKTVAATLAETGLQPHRLELEITENLLLNDSDAVLTELHSLKALGVTIVMDDFGTGYSSLSYLWRFPFNKIKIDRSCMLGFDTADTNVKTILTTIVALGRLLNMRVTAEGVETSRHADFARTMQCDEVQGFYFGRPMPVTDLAGWILTDFKGRFPQADAAELASKLARA